MCKLSVKIHETEPNLSTQMWNEADEGGFTKDAGAMWKARCIVEKMEATYYERQISTTARVNRDRLTNQTCISVHVYYKSNGTKY